MEKDPDAQKKTKTLKDIFNRGISLFFFCFLFSVFCFFTFLLYGIYTPKSAVYQEPQLFAIAKGEGVRQIARNLREEGIIGNDWSFLLYVFKQRATKKLQAGKYELSSSMPIPEIVTKFVRGETAKEKITVIEGWGLNEIARALEEKGILKQEDFYEVTGFPIFKISEESPGSTSSGENSKCFAAWPLLQSQDFSEEFSFLKDKPKNLNLEGYLFPDTYEIDENTDAAKIVRQMLTNFDNKLSPETREEIKRQGKTISDVIIMASMLEREVKTFRDKKLVAGILWKRLEIGLPLQVDATVLYSVGRRSGSISSLDIEICSPYNTYKYRGLPIGPISNPGLESILAAVYSQESNFWYYLSTPEGDTLFSQTLAEHNIKKIRFLYQ